MSLEGEILDRLGRRAIAAELGISRSTVDNWPSIGIPWKWHGRLLAFAEQNGITLSREELELARGRNGGAGDMDISGPSAPALPERGNADA